MLNPKFLLLTVQVSWDKSAQKRSWSRLLCNDHTLHLIRRLLVLTCFVKSITNSAVKWVAVTIYWLIHQWMFLTGSDWCHVQMVKNWFETWRKLLNGATGADDSQPVRLWQFLAASSKKSREEVTTVTQACEYVKSIRGERRENWPPSTQRGRIAFVVWITLLSVSLYLRFIYVWCTGGRERERETVSVCTGLVQFWASRKWQLIFPASVTSNRRNVDQLRTDRLSFLCVECKCGSNVGQCLRTECCFTPVQQVNVYRALQYSF